VYGGAVFHGMGSGYTSLADQMNGDSASIARGMAILAGMGAGYVKERGFEEWWRAAHLVGEAHRHGITVSGHCEHVLPAIAAGMDGMEHVLDCRRDRYTLREDYAELLRASGLWVVPTAALYWTVVRGMHDSTVASGPEIDPFLARSYRALYTADAANRRNYERFSAAVARVQRGVRRLREAGVTIASGGDTPYPLGIQQEMEVLVESGLTPMEAIVAATGAAAKVLNAPEIGTIAEGQWADLVLLSANPLEDIRNTRRIREVIQGGRVVDRESLRKRGLSP
jgi:imidazolonepropionase-like amidohydrolase